MNLKVCSLHPQSRERVQQRAKRKRIRHLPTRKSLTGKSRCLKSTRLFTEFEKNVLKTVKKEINEMTDLWFDYEPFVGGESENTNFSIFLSSIKIEKR